MNNLDTDSQPVKKDSQSVEDQLITDNGPDRAGDASPRKVTEADLAAQDVAIERTLTEMGLSVPPNQPE